MHMSRPSKKSSGGPLAVPLEACPLSERWPALAEFLSSGAWDNGDPRERGTMLLVWSDGRWRAWLNDKDTGAAAWMSGETLSEVLDDASEALREGSLEWRVVKPWAKKK